MAGTPGLLAVGSTRSIGAAATWSRHVGPVDGGAVASTLLGAAGAGPVSESTARRMREASTLAASSAAAATMASSRLRPQPGLSAEVALIRRTRTRSWRARSRAARGSR